MGDKRLSEVIDWDKHIAPYKIVEIVSGVGSGKNYWVEHDLMRNKRVLLITSRKKKVEETNKRTGISTCLNFSETNALSDLLSRTGRFPGQCICNNWQIEYYVKNTYDPQNEKTFLWNYFDVIILDEAHSMATDATFCDAPFHTWELIKEIYRKSNVKVILMTATPGPINGLFRDSNSHPEFKVWDFTNDCVSVSPHSIYISTSNEVIKSISSIYQKYQEGKNVRLVYFANTVDRISELIANLGDNGIPEEEIAISHSKDKKRKKFSQTINDGMDYVEEYLPAHEDIPPEKFIFITTSKSKEGINISNKDFAWYVFTESHYPDEIKQMWGRIRHGLKSVIIVFDAHQFNSIFCYDEPAFLVSKHAIPAAENALSEWYKKQSHKLPDKNENWRYNQAISKTVKCIEDQLGFVRYSYLKNRFMLYKGCVEGNRTFSLGKSYFDDYLLFRFGYLNFNTPPFLFDRDINILISSGVCSIFEGEIYTRAERLNTFFEERGYFKPNSIKVDDEAIILDFIYEIGIRQKKGTRYTQIGPAIKPYGFKVHSPHRKKEETSKQIRRISARAMRTELELPDEGELL